MIAVVNYGAGNLPNVVRALQHVGAELTVSTQADEIAQADAVVLPGVGATADTMRSLRELGLLATLQALAVRGTPFLGICVGMQVLLTQSEEFGLHECLGVLAGTVRRLPATAGKVPQIGWNQLQISAQAQQHALFADIPQQAEMYFVHSYYCDVADDTLVAARTAYGLDFPSVLLRERLAAVQFHPEKSGRHGLQLLRNFVTWSAQCSK